jgi:hypothetical protein
VDKKPLIGVCICAVVLLVLGSLSNVVGYQSVKSTTVNDSPLFQTRTQRAINIDSKGLLTSEYLGKGKDTLLILIANDRALLYQKVIDGIRSMDETTFNNFVTMVIHQKNLVPKLKNINSQDIITGLTQLKNNQNILPNHNFALNDKVHAIPMFSTQGIACIIYNILNFILGLFVWFYMLLSTILIEDCLYTISTMCCR